jgi:orotate phosphoribosyltransferase
MASQCRLQRCAIEPGSRRPQQDIPDPLSSTAAALAADLLSIGAVALSPSRPFTWASGLLSPIYCDNRLTLAHPPIRRRIRDGFAGALREAGADPTLIVGTATAGIPHAAWLADHLDLPMAYARSTAKAHGRGNRIEGRVPEGATAVVVEDLISTGGSSVAAVEAVREAGARVAAVLAIFTYGLPDATLSFERAGVPLVCLTDLETLLSVAAAQQRLSAEELEILLDWRRDPHAWSHRHATP